MTVLFIVLPLAIVMAAIFLTVFIICVRRGQYDDLDTPPLRMLFDDEPNDRGKRNPRE
jgi:cbb3-type cytochrome oxidase maturation protein